MKDLLHLSEDLLWEKVMEIESYFEFIGEDTIRIVGTRVGIETVLDDYREGASPEEIILRYPTLSRANPCDCHLLSGESRKSRTISRSREKAAGRSLGGTTAPSFGVCTPVAGAP